MPITQINCIACGEILPVPIFSIVGQLCDTCKNQGLFRKRIIITGITRMNRGNICVSGIDPETWRFIRPVFPSGLNRDFVMEGTTQVVRHFNVVEMEFKKYKPANEYHTEDWLINENYAPKFIKHLSDQDIIKILNYISISNLKLELEKKDKSLYIVKAKKIIKIWHEQYEKFKVRINFMDISGNIYYHFPVTDLLLLAYVRYMIINKKNYEMNLINRFNSNPYRYIRIGLTRAFLDRPYWEQITALITIPDIFDGKSFAYYENQIGEKI